jgi:hypothetical protein
MDGNDNHSQDDDIITCEQIAQSSHSTSIYDMSRQWHTIIF